MSARKRKKRKKRKTTKARRGRGAPSPARLDVQLDGLRAIVERAVSEPIGTDERDQLIAVIETLAFLTQELERSEVTVARLRKLLFGSSSEKTRDVVEPGTGTGRDTDASPTDTGTPLGTDEAGETDGRADGTDEAGGGDKIDGTDEAGGGDKVDGGNEVGASGDPAAEKKKRKGHGRIGAAAYTGAEKVSVCHDCLQHGDLCPECRQGRVYRQANPAVLVRVRGIAPLQATVYELERLRCNLCLEVFTAPAPPGVGEKKYDETAAAMIALLKYGCGLPFNRLEQLGRNLGMPLPAGTQWGVVAEAGESVEPVWAELVRQAAGGDVVQIDDTNMVVLSLAKRIKEELAAGETDRTGIFTSGVISIVDERRLAVYFTGREHAGENLDKVLAQRSPELSPPILMCDALSRNTSPGEFDTILANCLAHARRKFVDVVGSFPEEVARVLEDLREVYGHDAKARAEGMSPNERLAYHQEHSRPIMDELKKWLDGLLDDKKVEPNSSLGGAIRYIQNHWDGLTLFLREPGAPLDNNLCERVLKRAIVHRKNSLFYKTENGARVGDMFLSVIHTAELCDANPFDYLVALQCNREAVAAHPERWMPWNYTETIRARDG